MAEGGRAYIYPRAELARTALRKRRGTEGQRGEEEGRERERQRDRGTHTHTQRERERGGRRRRVLEATGRLVDSETTRW